MADTHDVVNQVPPLESDGYNPAANPAFREALIREGGSWAMDEIDALGALAGSPEIVELGDQAERHHPVLRTHDRYGHRVDEVAYDPAYHRLMSIAVSHGLHAAPWADPRPGAHVVRAGKMSVWTPEPGHVCPISMTYAIVPALRNAPQLADDYEPLLTSRAYDPSSRPAAQKRGIIAGMSMTEKQGGSDVRANHTTATPNGDGGYTLVGHKWFTSAPMSDVFLVLAQAPGGLSCFLLPRILPDGTRNRMRLQRLKDKLGNRANASSEVEYDGATAWLVGEEGRGVRTIIAMVNLTRLDCALASAQAMRHALAHAAHHALHREVFGRRLATQPAMVNVLADLQLEAEAATAVAMRLAGATDAAERGDERAGLLRRLALPAVKYWVCKRATGHVAESLECLGGNGYVEDSRMPRMLRDAPLTGIWEGSGNVSALDTLRAVAAAPKTLDALTDELDAAAGRDSRYDEYIGDLKDSLFGLPPGGEAEFAARRIAECIATALAASVLLRDGDPDVAEGYVASRLVSGSPAAYGTLSLGVAAGRIAERAFVLS